MTALHFYIYVVPFTFFAVVLLCIFAPMMSDIAAGIARPFVRAGRAIAKIDSEAVFTAVRVVGFIVILCAVEAVVYFPFHMIYGF